MVFPLKMVIYPFTELPGYPPPLSAPRAKRPLSSKRPARHGSDRRSAGPRCRLASRLALDRGFFGTVQLEKHGKISRKMWENSLKMVEHLRYQWKFR